MSDHPQLFDALPKPVEDALRASIQRFGVLVPVVRDQHGNMIDGRHRARIADELKVRYRVDSVNVADEDEAREIQRTLNADRRHLSGEQLRQHVVFLAEQTDAAGVGAYSEATIAKVVGVDQSHVNRTLRDDQLMSSHKLPESRRGADGKVRPARRPTVVSAKSEREAERAQQALQALGADTPPRDLDTKRIERIAREHAAEQRRAEPVEAASTHADIEIRHGDFREVLADLTDVDAIITDPPYPKRFWEPYSEDNVYTDLGVLAARCLRQDGVLAVMTGTRLEMLDSVDAQLGHYMRRRHRAVYLTPGPRWRDNLERVATGYKPILIYAHPASRSEDLRWINDDVFGSHADDKQHHHWGQSESGIADLVERLTQPGDLVVDPFLGGGTTAVVCKALGRRFVGCDIDPGSVAISRERVA